jgi:hypothetical protein
MNEDFYSTVVIQALIINKNDCSGSNEYMNINEINQQLDRLNHLDDMYDDEGNVSRTMVFES